MNNQNQSVTIEGTINGAHAVSSPTTPGITGYRNLTQAEKDLMNRIKAKGAELQALIEEVRAVHIREVATFNYADATQEQRTAFNAHVGQGQHWRMRAVDSLQDGLMQLTRSVARPTTFA